MKEEQKNRFVYYNKSDFEMLQNPLNAKGKKKMIRRISKPDIKPNESEDDYLTRCIPFVIRNEGLDGTAAAGKCRGMFQSNKKTNKRFNLGIGSLINIESDPSEEKVLTTKFFPVEKASEELQFVTGIVLEPEVEDGQGDIYDEEEIRKAAHKFMADYLGQGNGVMHKSYGSAALRIVESYIAPVDFKLEGGEVKKGTWIMSTIVKDDTLWASIKKGEITGYSIRGLSNAKQA